ncbi:MAG: beta-galactosidase [Desulfatiglandaceae bacterium]
MSQVEIVDGVLYLNGDIHFVISADYPYFRDRPENWADRLERLVELGQNVVTCYIPWRHHEFVINEERQFDFVGEHKPNGNVIGFLSLCHTKGLYVIAKPGPFIHAETNYGGLPDFVCPMWRSEIESMKDSEGKPVCWPGNELRSDGKTVQDWPLPAPLDPVFLTEVEHWLQAIADQVIKPLTYPDGPIVAVQLGNEGIYSNAQHGPWAYDYSGSSLDCYRRFLQAEYQDLGRYNQSHALPASSWDEIRPPRKWVQPSRVEDALWYMHWSAYQAEYLNEFYQHLASSLDVQLPYLVNINPPLSDTYGVDAWLSRVNPDVWSDVHYGFTNWIGAACDDPSTVDRYQIMIKRKRGVNLEENWGFSELYGNAFSFDSASFYQTLLAIALGATGFNIYTGVQTSDWEIELDRFHRKPYPTHAPVNKAGELTPKSRIVSLMNEFFAHYGAELLQTKPARFIAWGFYLPYAHIQAWRSVDMSLEDAVFPIPDCGTAISRFARQLLEAHIDFELINLQSVEDEILHQFPFLVLSAGSFMDRDTQERLARYSEGNRKLLVIGDLPHLDGEFNECEILRNYIETITVIPRKEFYEKNIVGKLTDLGLPRSILTGDSSFIWQYSHQDQDIQYLFVLTPRDHIGPIEFEYEIFDGLRRVELQLPPASGGVIRVEDGRLSAALLKGTNDYLKKSDVPFCMVNGSTLSADKPCDLLITQTDDGYVVRAVAESGGNIKVKVPNGQVKTCRAE